MKKTLSLLLAMVMVLCLIPAAAYAGAEVYRPYDLTLTTDSIIFKEDVNTSDAVTRWDMFILAGSSGETAPISVDINEFDAEGFKLYDGYCIKANGSSEVSGNPGATFEKLDDDTFAITIIPSKINGVKFLSADNPYIWLVVAPCDAYNRLDQSKGTSGHYDVYNSTVCLGKFGSMENFKTVTVDNDHSHDNVTFTPWGDGAGEAEKFPMTSGNYYLTKDLTITQENYIRQSKSADINICLNGHVINVNGERPLVYCQESDIKYNLNIYDCSETIHKFMVNEDTGLWTLDEENGTKELKGGVITGGTYTLGVISLKNATADSTLTLNGGNIVGNNINDNDYGVITISKANFIMNGGNIIGNVCQSSIIKTGGNYQNSDGHFTMNGGAISDNTVNSGKGIIYSYSGTITINDGEITNNKSSSNIILSDGAAPVFNMSGGSITDNHANTTVNIASPTVAEFTGGTISNNTSENNGAGVYAGSSKVTVGGTAVITGNKKAGSPSATDNNIYLPYSGNISIGTKTSSDEGNGVKAPTSAMSIGISRDNFGAFTSNGTGADTAYFTADSSDAEIAYENNALVLGKKRTSVTINAEVEDFTFGESGKTGYTNLSVTDNLIDVSELVKTYFKETETEGTYETTGTTAVPTAPGNYKLVISVPENNKDYKGSKELEFTIAPITAELVWSTFGTGDDAYKSVYDAQDQTPLITVYYTKLDGTKEYLPVRLEKAVKLLRKSGGGVQFLNAGDYLAHALNYWNNSKQPFNDMAQFDMDSNYTLPETTTQGYTMKPAEVTVTANSAEMYVGDSFEDGVLADIGATVDGLLGEDYISEYGISCEVPFDDNFKLTTAGEYEIVVDVASDAAGTNYNVTGVNGTLTVNSKSSGSNPAITVPVSGDENSINVKATVSGNAATVQPIGSSEIQKVIGSDVDTGMVVIDLSGLKQNVEAAKLPAETVEAIAKAAAETGNDTAGLELKLGSGALEFDAKALEAISAAAENAEKIEIHFDDVGTRRLNAVQKNAVSEMEIVKGFEAYITVNGQRISDFEGGTATVYIPYEIPEDKDPAAYTVWYVAEDGTLEKMDATYDGENHRFVVTHFSDYVLTYDETVGQFGNCPKDDTCPISKFTDANANAWYHDGVHFCLDNGIMVGFPGDLFKPDGITTRAQIVTVLWNMSGNPYPNYALNFTDVPEEAWYTEAVRWAAAEKIVSGYGDDTFGPNEPITREQLAVILYNYAKYKGIDVTVDENTNFLSFNDFWDVSEWAKPAMMWAIDRELIVGDNWDLKPQGDAVRAQAATIIWKFCETVVK